MRKGIAILLITFVLFGCKKDKRKPAFDYTPGKPVLAFPAKDAACNNGADVSNTQSSVVFSWNSAANAETYQLTIKNLYTGITMPLISTSNLQIEVTLLKNTPYSWFVTGKTSKTTVTTSSDVWKFYNSGTGIISHPPFPAEIISPTMGAHIATTSGIVSISWFGSDVDNDISSYYIYFGTKNPPPLIDSNYKESILNNVKVSSNSTYYWRIVTKDAKGNTSDSGVSLFDVINSPIADFDVNGASTTINTSQRITFRDKSTNSPTSWSWSFPGGSPSSSSLQNPTVTYPNAGVCSVSLTATNQHGSNTKTITNYLTVNAWTCGQPFTDPRDGITYNTVSINGQCWMTENLKYTKNGTVGATYGNDDAYYSKYGRLYSWNEVQNSKLAPSGWHIPTDAEIKSLAGYLQNAYTNNEGGALKATSDFWVNPNTGATNQTGFTALPSGYSYNGVFRQAGLAFNAWTSTPQGNDGLGYFLNNDSNSLGELTFNNNYLMAIRCVKD